jgi:hypothetical protein
LFVGRDSFRRFRESESFADSSNSDTDDSDTEEDNKGDDKVSLASRGSGPLLCWRLDGRRCKAAISSKEIKMFCGASLLKPVTL